MKKIIFSKDFASRHKTLHKHFTRNRLLTFPTLLFFLMNLLKGSIQDELDYFFKALNRWDVCRLVVSKSAFCRARKKIRHEAFVELNNQQVRFFYNHFLPLTWYGLNLIACDGSTGQVPKTDEIAAHFGQWYSSQGPPCPVARLSQMFDVLNGLTIDAIIGSKEIGEREMASLHIFNLRPTDLLLLDRGYPAFWLFKLILHVNGNFCARISNKQWAVVKKFYYSGKPEKVVSVKPSYESKKKCHELGLDANPLQLRLIRVELESGEAEILITSLMDSEAYPNDIFQDLYHQRWPVEEDYKVMKHRIEIENWTGKSVESVYQDFHAKVFTKNLFAIMAFPARAAIDRKTAHRKHKYQLNFTQALSKFKDIVVLLFNRENILSLIAELHEIFAQYTEPIRPGRKYPRRKKIGKRSFFTCYKPIR